MAAGRTIGGDLGQGDGWLLVVLAGLALGTVMWRRASRPAPVSDARPPTVVLVVLDTVRADHTSACGYGRPTTPVLDQLIASRGASVVCDTVAPASWTLPSHASFFTGLPVQDHGAHFVPLDQASMIGAMQVRPLGPDAPTLAEDFASAGYQTLLISGNPVLGEASGLTRGFDRAKAAKHFGGMLGEDLIRPLRRALRRKTDPTRPLFLVLNVADAHQPWHAVPSYIEWAPAQKGTQPRMDDVFQQRLVGEALATHLEGVANAYDYGIFRADRTLGEALELLEDEGWSETGLRLVVVSDHGEFLGEHGLVDHGRYLWEPNQRIFMLHAWLGPGEPRGEAHRIPTGLSGVSVHGLVLDGSVGPRPDFVTAAAWPDAFWQQQSGGRLGTSTSAAIWSGDEKLLWQDGVMSRFDLVADPAEANPLSLDADHPLRPDLDSLVAEVLESAGGPAPMDPALIEQLQAAGYMDGGAEPAAKVEEGGDVGEGGEVEDGHGG
jgi:arylsulfatase A-like enzyme